MADDKYPRLEKFLDTLRVAPNRKIDLRKDYDPGFTGSWMNKTEARATLAEGITDLAAMQDMLYAQDTYGVLVVLQALDAAGKDGAIKHVMSGVNPQGVNVHSFKAPSSDDLDHDYLYRSFAALPRRGQIAIFNRSYYEETLVVRVHPDFLARQKLPAHLADEKIWKRRFSEINAFEKYLVENGIIVLKIFLYVSKEAQKERFLERALFPEKNWKFSAADMRERSYWDQYIDAYEDMFNHTSTAWAPWHIVPADHKWFSRLAVAAVIYKGMLDLKLAYPKVSEEQLRALAVARDELIAEGGAQSEAVVKATEKAIAAGHDVPASAVASGGTGEAGNAKAAKRQNGKAPAKKKPAEKRKK
jgi:PPK2 family polyphosphate:nucleotide phosphotransferase